MKNPIRKTISNWRLLFITLIFLSLLSIIMRDEIKLDQKKVEYLYYAIYCFLALSYADVLWIKFSKTKRTNDILDNED